MAISFEHLPEPRTLQDWEALRPTVLGRLQRIYGATPTTDVSATVRQVGQFELVEVDGACTQSAVTLHREDRSWTFTVMAITPSRPPRGVFLGLNFRGNHTVVPDPRVIINEAGDTTGTPLHYENAEFLPPAPRGSLAHRWPVDVVLERGFALVTTSYLECGPDTRGIFDTGPHALLRLDPSWTGRPWGAIGIWAWTLSRVLDLILADRLPGVPAAPTFAIGHSRLGKTALWAAAQDERFAGAISNNSGAMGAALSREVGETPRLLAQVRPYWFTPEFNEAALRGLPLPADQWHLLATVAPRLLLVGSADDDLPADPEGERLSTIAASNIWRLHGQLEPWEPGPARTGYPIGHHRRPGGHDLLQEDWEHYLRDVGAFLDR